MAGVKNQALWPLKIIEILREETDQNNMISTGNLLDQLYDNKFELTRKALLRNIHLLNDSGYKIKTVKKNKENYYYLESDDLSFNLDEAMVLLDLVDTAKFLPEKDLKTLRNKVKSLIGPKIEKLPINNCNVEANGFASKKDSDFIKNFQIIYTAILSKIAISFRYFDLSIDYKKVYRSSTYKVYPIDTVICDNKYYLICLNLKYPDTLSTFRIDKMAYVKHEEPYEPDKKLIENYCKDTLLDEVVLMHIGASDSVKLKVKNTPLIGNILIDNFGKNIELLENNEDYFTVAIKIKTSDKFKSWISSYKDIEIIE